VTNLGNTALTICCIENNYESLNFLLKYKDETVDGAGIDINHMNTSKEFTGLMYACFNGNTEIIKLLLSYKADVTIVNSKEESALTLAQNEDILLLIEEALREQYLLK
jgi:ankyrin repeat protein